MGQQPIEDRLEALERRLARLEETVGAVQGPLPAAAPPPPLPALAAETLQEESSVRPQPLPQPLTTHLQEMRKALRYARQQQTLATPPPIPVQRIEEPADVELWDSGSPAPQQQPPAPRPVEAPLPLPAAAIAKTDNATVIAYQPQKPFAKKPLKPNAFETTLGLKWTGWVGAVLLVIGAAFAVKYAYDQGIFSRVPKGVWLTVIFCFGGLLLAAGEYVHRKINDISAASLFGAGVATFFLASYVGHSYYRLYDPTTAFALMGVSTLVGAAVAMRGNLVSIAVLSIIGGNVAPVLLRPDQPKLLPFLSYLLMLEVVALVLAWWGSKPKWWALRGLSLATTGLWVCYVLLELGPKLGADPKGAPLVFSLLYAGLYQLELILSSLRKREAPAEGLQEQNSPGVVFSIVATAAITAAVIVIFSASEPFVRGAWVLVFAGICGVLGWALAGRKQALAAMLSQAYRVQAAALVVVAAPVALSGIAVTLGWAGMALAFAVMGAILNSRISRYAAIATWFLALAWLLGHTFDFSGGREVDAGRALFSILGTIIHSHSVIGWALAPLGQAVAYLARMNLRDEAGEHEASRWNAAIRRDSAATSIVACIVWAAVSIAALPALGATFMIVAGAWMMTALDLLPAPLPFAAEAAALLVVATIKWVVVDTLAGRLDPNWNAAAYRPVVNPLMGVGTFIAVSALAIYRARRQRFEELLAQKREISAGSSGVFFAGLIVALLAIGLSFEIDRTVERAVVFGKELIWPAWQMRHLAWSMLWMASLATFLLLATRLQRDAARRARWGRFAWICAILLIVKFLLIDTLLFRFNDGAAACTPVANFQTLTAAVLVAGLIFIRWLGRADMEVSRLMLRTTVAMAAALVIIWAGTFEIDRDVQLLYSAAPRAWRIWQFKQMCWTIWWTCGTTAMILYLQRFEAIAAFRAGHLRRLSMVLLLLAGKYLLLDALFFRLWNGAAPAAVFANIQALTAAVVAGAIIVAWRVARPLAEEFPWVRGTETRFGGALVLITLMAGSLEIDRAMEGAIGAQLFADPALAKQVAFSIYWAIFALGSVAVGFRARAAAMRYLGLGLFGLTLVKVVLVDLKDVSTGYRIVSFMGLGALLIGTSILYGKLSPRLLGGHSQPNAPGGQDA
jgi:uncharacterized membrane protein